MKRSIILIIILLALVPGSYAAENFKNSSKAESEKQKAPPPDNVSYVKPTDDVPKTIQNLLGKWEGDWGGQLNSYMIFEEVTADSARMIYGFGPQPAIGDTKGGYSRYTVNLVYSDNRSSIDFEFDRIKGSLSADGKTINAVYNGRSLISMKKTEDPFTDN
jgi:hypothetical protein